MRKGREVSGKWGRWDSRLLLNISVMMERDRITGRQEAPSRPALPLPLNSKLSYASGHKHPGVTLAHFSGHISFPLYCPEVLGHNVP